MSTRRGVVSKAVTYLGAAIILATFVVKDVLRDQLKELKDSISAGETFYLSQTSLNNVLSQAADLQLQVELLTIRVAYMVPSDVKLTQSESDNLDLKKARDQSRAGFLAMKNQLAIDEEFIKTLSRLIDKLPHAEVEKKEMDSLVENTKRLTEEAASLPDKYESVYKETLALDEKFGDDEPPARVANRLMKRMQAVQKTSADLGSQGQTYGARVKSLTSVVLGRVHTEEEESERRYARASKASYVLYGIGWFLGLLGKILGGSGTAEET